jgi:hypothetical protein
VLVEEVFAVKAQPTERRKSALKNQIMPRSIKIDGVVNLILLPIVITAVIVYHIDVVAVAEIFICEVQTIVQQIIIGIGKDNVFALGMVNTVVAGRRNALVFLVDKPEMRIFLTILLTDGHRTVFRPVIDEYHLILPVAKTLMEYGVKTFPQIFLDVINRYDDGDGGYQL